MSRCAAAGARVGEVCVQEGEGGGGGGGDFENWTCDLVDDGFDAPAPARYLCVG